ncbi:hypothetical protein QMK19_23225 [Streptomyces sp. H10-C2]|nr:MULTISPECIES: MAB_1171c family putative transporter [unclassified Streptomyces]MDJ0342819.1 hypothetical protein [Streptomyces sp. PH10-H1]MDJ0372497.1 hypothetical protein [Streptomyces sp. H10-C2]
MTAVAIWRFPAVLHGDARRRALWGCYAGFALALWIKSPGIKSALNHSVVTDLSVLLKHYVSIGAILAILTYVVACYGKPGRDVPRHVAASRAAERLAYQASVGALMVMTGLFFTVVRRDAPSTDFAAEHAGQWGATLYLSVFYVYLGTAVVICGYQWSRAARWAETRLLRAGLVLMSLSMAIGILYTLCRTAFLWIAIAVPIEGHRAVTITHATDFLQTMVFFLFAAGVSVPTVGAVTARWQSARALWELYPLWHDLMTAVPDLGFARPASRLREVTRTSPPLDIRLDRCLQDIGDAVEQLRHYAPPKLLLAAEEAATEHDDAAVATEAHWINAVLVAAAAGERHAAAAPALPTKPIATIAGEAAWLQQVQHVYATLTREQGRDLLDAVAKEPAR